MLGSGELILLLLGVVVFLLVLGVAILLVLVLTVIAVLVVVLIIVLVPVHFGSSVCKKYKRANLSHAYILRFFSRNIQPSAKTACMI